GTRLGYTYTPWQLSAFFEGRNLTNAAYVSSVQVDSANRRFFEPADGRAFYGGLEWRFRSAWWLASSSSGRLFGAADPRPPPRATPSPTPPAAATGSLL